MTTRDEACVDAAHDTWRPWPGAARWTWAPVEPPASDAREVLNPWAAGEVTRLLDALDGFARVRMARLDGPADGPMIVPAELTPAPGQASAAFEASVIAAIRGAAGPVVNVDLELDLRVWTRAAATGRLACCWVAFAATASLFNRAASPDGSLRIDNTLFIDGALVGGSNHELHELNQPRLREALAAIAAGLGPIVEVEGLPGIVATGFASAVTAMPPLF